MLCKRLILATSYRYGDLILKFATFDGFLALSSEALLGLTSFQFSENLSLYGSPVRLFPEVKRYLPARAADSCSSSSLSVVSISLSTAALIFFRRRRLFVRWSLSFVCSRVSVLCCSLLCQDYLLWSAGVYSVKVATLKRNEGGIVRTIATLKRNEGEIVRTIATIKRNEGEIVRTITD